MKGELQNFHLFFALIVVLHEGVNYLLKFIRMNKRLCVFLSPFWQETIIFTKSNIILNLMLFKWCINVTSLTLYSCPDRMFFCRNYQRHIRWVWFSCWYTGGILEHNVAHFKALEGTEGKLMLGMDKYPYQTLVRYWWKQLDQIICKCGKQQQSIPFKFYTMFCLTHVLFHNSVIECLVELVTPLNFSIFCRVTNWNSNGQMFWRCNIIFHIFTVSHMTCGKLQTGLFITLFQQWLSSCHAFIEARFVQD